MSASERDLAEYATASQPGVHNALIALSGQGMIERLSSNRFLGLGTTWMITPVEDLSLQVMINDNFPTGTGAAYEIAEIWAQVNLDRVAGTVYRLLSDRPINIRRLARITGKSRSAIKSALERRLSSSGLAITVEGDWIRGTTKLSNVAESLATKKTAKDNEKYLQNYVQNIKRWRSQNGNNEKLLSFAKQQIPWEMLEILDD